MRPHGLGAVEASTQVDAQVAFPELRALVVELPDVVERPRVVDEDVDGAELVHGPGHRRGDLLAIRHVAPNRERATAEGANLLDRLLGVHHALCACGGGERAPAVRLLGELRLDQDVRDHDVRPRSSQRQRVGPPEASGAPGDEGDPAAEVDLERHDETLEQSPRGRKISLAITRRWICDVPS